MNTTAALQSAPTDWTDFVFTQPLLPLELRSGFFVTAPEGTLVEVDGDLYQLNPAHFWTALNEVVMDYNFGEPYATHANYTPDELLNLTSSPSVVVRVLRLN